MFLTIDPVDAGLVASLARPGGNITGLTLTAGPDIYGKQLQLLKDAFPGTSRVAILLNPSTATYAHTLREIETAIHALRLERQVISVADPSDFNGAFASLAAAHVDAMNNLLHVTAPVHVADDPVWFPAHMLQPGTSRCTSADAARLISGYPSARITRALR